MEFLESGRTDPRWNLALEQYVFDRMNRAKEYLLLWQNEHTIVVGKNQNTVQEINSEFVRQSGITVVRRLSGGGAVYHDLGNLNFTFITDAENGGQLNFQAFCMPVVETLRTFGITAEISGRNDITVEGKKFSGNSQYIREGRVMHHGTILFDSDLSVVERALRVEKSKIESKSIISVRSRVTNLRDYLGQGVTLELFKQRLIEVLRAQREIRPFSLTDAETAAISKIKQERYDTWAWNYGRSPSYTDMRSRRIDGCGQVAAAVSVEGGSIKDIQFFGDFFGSGDTEELAERLRGCDCCRKRIEERLQNFRVEYYIRGMNAYILAKLIAP